MELYCVFMLVMRLYCVFVLIMRPLIVIGTSLMFGIYICELYPYIMLNLYICNLRCALRSADWPFCCIFFLPLENICRRISRRQKPTSTDHPSTKAYVDGSSVALYPKKYQIC